MGALPALDGATAAVHKEVEAGRRVRLLYLVTRAERGGAQAHVLDLTIGMSQGFDVEVATGEEGFLTETCRGMGVPVHVVPYLKREIKPFEDLRGAHMLVQLMRRIQPDIVHAHTFKAGFLGRLAAKHLKIASVYTVHMWPFGRAVPLSWRLAAPSCERLAAGWCDRIITVSETTARIATKYGICEASKVTSIRNGIPDHGKRARLEGEGEVRCTMVARFTRFKDHALLLRAFATVPGKPRLVLIGGGETLSAANRLTQKLGIQERVEFTGIRTDVPEFLARMDVFVLASKQETMPISILEAMRAGLPVIASDVGGVSEAVVHGETGLLVPPGSAEALGSALTRLLADRALRIAMGNAGRAHFEKMFQASTMIEKTAALYGEVLEQRMASR